MVVLGIIALLALMSLPLFIERSVQQQVKDGIGFAEFMQKGVGAAYAITGVLPKDNVSAALPAPDKIIGSYVTSATVANGAITLTFGNLAASNIKGKKLTLRPGFTYTDLVLKAAATVLAAMPEMNAYIDGDEIVSLGEVSIGLAIALDGGLIVPVIRNVDRLTLVELSLARQELIAKARAGNLTRADVNGGSFTLSNFGSYGGDFETPILNAPQSALLGIGQISDEAVVRDKQIVIRPMMSISLTFDHCLIDGALAGEFRSRFKALMEQPALLLARLR